MEDIKEIIAAILAFSFAVFLVLQLKSCDETKHKLSMDCVMSGKNREVCGWN